MLKTAAQMQSIKRAVEETAMFSASIIAKVKSKIKKIESSFNISPSASTCSPNDKYGGTGGSQSITRGADDNKSKMLFQKKTISTMIIRAKCSFKKHNINYLKGEELR